MDSVDAVRCMLTAGKQYSISTTDMSALVLKLITLSVKYVSKKRVWNERFGEEAYVDWSLVDSMTTRNVLGGCSEWMALLTFCKWEDMMKQSEAGIQTSYPPLFVLRKHLRESNLDTGDGDAWTVACKVFLLMLVQGMPSQHSLEVLTCSVFRRDTRAGCTSLLARQASLAVSVFARVESFYCLIFWA